MMFRLTVILLVGCAVHLCPASGPADARQTERNEPPEGFVRLFNGKDLSGWKGLVGKPHERAAMTQQQLAEAQREANELMRDHWTVQNGVLMFDGEGKSLCTARDYADFEMFVDWKIESKGDSGIYVRGLPQIQIWDPATHPEGSGGLYNNKVHPSRPLVRADHPVGEWNTFFIRMVGDRVTVDLNGQRVVDNVVLENLWEPDRPVYPSGQIELQSHGSRLWFRNIFIRELVTAEEIQRIQAALPASARAEPRQPRRVLAFTRATGFRHRSIPHGAHAVLLMGQQTGAYDTTISDDLTLFAPGSLEQFDAVVLSNTTGNWIQPTPVDVKRLYPDGGKSAKEVEVMLREELVRYVQSGNGLVGFHSATDANYHWPEFGRMLGGYFDGHPWHENVSINVERPANVLSSAFGGKEFSIVDEIYQFRDPYSRNKLHVLLSLDTTQTDMNKDSIRRSDGDFAVAWIRRYGQGRVFYSSLGHREEIFWNPMILRFYLDGIQFAVGDLKVETAL